MRRYYEYKDLYDEIDYIKANSDRYILGKDLTKKPCPGITLKSLEDVQDELKKAMKDLIALMNKNKGFEDSAKYEMPQSANKPDYAFRIAMPLPLDFLDQGVRIDQWDVYKKNVCDKWIRPISTIRGQMYSPTDPGCLNNAQIHEYESNVYYLAIVGGKIEIPGMPARTWGEQSDIEKALELLILKNNDGAKSSLYFRAMPGSYKRVVGITNPGNEVLWGNATEKKQIALYWTDTAYLSFSLGLPDKTGKERIVGGIFKEYPNLWGCNTSYSPVNIPNDGLALYIGS